QHVQSVRGIVETDDLVLAEDARDTAADEVVVVDEHQTATTFGSLGDIGNDRWRRRARRPPRREEHPEPAALFGDTFYREGPSHRCHDASGNGQTEPR